ncbi:hypothetical protein HX004_17400 [Myroides sp. 1354]|uniref:hypothetical protein n=1 Tax=unclassified Myroides TaxID=2642485 RepID=UPI002577A27A|nr:MULTISPECIES: hypothetical protein [unclassified Myroides]MDM1046593.1 hypothetical protein [Myroides sp. R163-1]MDM1057529.1 hypothetical protein [Myroides sp. 1354]MDM1070822.1 hypothetical protein [Myroides sp. 1372]
MIVLIVLCVFVSCEQREITKKEIDSFINQYGKEDFSVFKGYTIEIRQHTFTETIYIVSENQEDNIGTTLFFVTFNKWSNNISEISKRDALHDVFVTGTLTDEELTTIIKEYTKYNFVYLKVDKENNIFINPFEMERRPFLLKLNKNSNTPMVKMYNYTFNQYENDWYVRQ